MTKSQNKLWKFCLRFAGLNALLLAIFHFSLPSLFDWKSGLGDAPDIFSWAFGVFNFSWSLMFSFLGVLVLTISKTGPSGSVLEKIIIVGLGLYWLIHGLYLVFNPTPLPSMLTWLGFVLIIFPFTVATFHLIPSWLSISAKEKP